MQTILNHLHGFAREEIWRVALTMTIMVLIPVLLKMSRSQVFKGEKSLSERRERHVVWRNSIILSACVAITGIWGSSLAGFAFSLAAITSAMLLVCKDAVLNLLGFISLTVSRPFGFGDYVHIGKARGRVVDISAMKTTVLETRQGHQVTGATITVPNGLLLTEAVRNLTVTGRFVVNLLHIQIERKSDVLEHEAALLAAADAACSSWQAEADEHLAHLEVTKNVDLPTAQAKVIIELRDAGLVDLTLRYACQPNDRVKVEQEILRSYIQATRHLNHGLPNPIERELYAPRNRRIENRH